MQPKVNERYTSRELSPVPEINRGKQVATEILKAVKRGTKMRKPKYRMKLRNIEKQYGDYESRLPSPTSYLSSRQSERRPIVVSEEKVRKEGPFSARKDPK